MDNPQNKLKSSISSPFTVADERLIAMVEEKLLHCTSLDEFIEIHGFLNIIKKDNSQMHYESQTQNVDLNKKKIDLFFYRLQRWLTIAIGVGLFISSFFIFGNNGLLGGVFFGTGLGALGISTLSLKSLLSK